MKNVGQCIFYRACALLPIVGALNPAGTVRQICPGPDISHSGGYGVDIAIGPVQRLNPRGKPVIAQPAMIDDRLIYLRKNAGVLINGRLPKIWYLTNIPEKSDASDAIDALNNVVARAQAAKGGVVFPGTRPVEKLARAGSVE